MSTRMLCRKLHLYCKRVKVCRPKILIDVNAGLKVRPRTTHIDGPEDFSLRAGWYDLVGGVY